MAEQIYANYNATTPLDNEVKKVMCEAAESAWGNPSSSSHQAGAEAKRLIEQARRQIAEMIEAQPEEIIFTSGGTESNNMVIRTALEHFSVTASQHGATQAHLVVSELEHDSVYDVAKHLQRTGQASATILEPDRRTGTVNVEQLLAAVRPETVLVSLILAQNETGVLQPVATVSKHLAALNATRHQLGLPPVLLHTDAAQAIGKVRVSVRDLNVDYLTIVGHKFYGPRIGALYVRGLGSHAANSAPIYPALYGGGQERGLRSGTENTPCIAALGQAAALVSSKLQSHKEHMHRVAQRFESQLRATLGDRVVFNSHFDGDSCEQHLPNTVNVALIPPAGCQFGDKYHSASVLGALSGKFHAGAGSACHGGRPSRVLLSCFGDPQVSAVPLRVINAIRFSFGRESTLEQADAIVAALQAYFDELETKCSAV